MARSIKPASPADPARVARAVALLREARDLLAAADCPQSLARVRAAIRSADGARRHVDRRSMRACTPAN